MKAPPFAYARAGSVEEALDLLGEAGEDAKPIAGGQSLVPALAYRLVRPSHLVDIDRLPGLAELAEADGALTVGALVRHAQLERGGLRRAHRLLALAARQIGHLPIRTRGTLGGSLAHADPAAELPAAACALDARVVVRSRDGERELGAADFFTGPFTTELRPGELVVALRVPAAALGSAAGFRELSVRAGDFALASAAIVVTRDEAGLVCTARVVLGAVEPVPRRVPEAEQALAGRPLDDAAADEAARIAAASFDAVGDRVLDAATRRDAVRALVRRALDDVRAEAA